MDFNKLYKELIRRNVFRAVLAYLAVAWVLIEVSSTILPTFGAPEYLIKGLIYLLGIGLVIWTGFSWVYDLTPEGIRRTPEEYDTTETRALNSRRLNAVIVGAGISAVLVLLAGSFWAGSQWNNANELAASSEYRIAVLPFEDRSDNAEFGYLAEGIAENIISDVFNHPSISVLSPQSTFRFRDPEISIGEISKELRADVLLIGNYTILEDRVDIQIEVVNGKDAQLMNYASFTGNLSQIGSISSRIGDKILDALALNRNLERSESISEHHVVDVDAYKFNVLGKSALRANKGQTREESIRYFEAAIAIDSTYVDPYIGIAEAHIFDVNRGYMSPAEAGQNIRKYVLKAEKLDPGSGRVSAVMGILRCFEFDFNNAIPYFEKAIDESPNFILTYHWYPGVLQYFGEFEKAEQLERKAGALDPLNDFTDVFLAKTYLFQGRNARAMEIVDKKLALEPDHKQMLWMKAIVQIENGLYDDAYETLVKREVGLETGFVSGYVFAKTGQVQRAEAVLKHMGTKTYVPPTQKAIVLCGLERFDEALDQLEEAFLVHDQWVGWALYSSMTDPLKDHPRYLALYSDFGR